MFPLQLGDWVQVQDMAVEPEVRDMLGADDMLVRRYQPAGARLQAELFVAYYKTQLRAKSAHDPKVCLPGSGWNPRDSRLIEVPMPGRHSLPVNYYRIAKNDDEAVVLYWFQTHKSAYTFEQQLRLHRVLDTIFDNRTDMALVRVVVAIGEGGAAAAERAAMQVAQLSYNQMLTYFPPKENAGS